MNSEAQRWQNLAWRLQFEVTAPATVLVGDESVTFTALLPQFGGEMGMIADPDWETFEPHADALLKLGYGFSAVELGVDADAEDTKEMLRDWGWSATEPRPDWW